MMCYIYDYDFCGENNKYLNTNQSATSAFCLSELAKIAILVFFHYNFFMSSFTS